MSATKIGFLSWGAAAVILIFQAISGLMQMTASWSMITIGSVTNGILDPYIEKISFETIADWTDFIVNDVELAILLGVIGLVCIIIGSFKKV